MAISLVCLFLTLVTLYHALKQPLIIENSLENEWILSSTQFPMSKDSSIVAYDSNHEIVIIFGGDHCKEHKQDITFGKCLCCYYKEEGAPLMVAFCRSAAFLASPKR